MDPVVAQALMAGAAAVGAGAGAGALAGVKDTSKQLVVDLYARLKRAFTGHEGVEKKAAETALLRLEDNPEEYRVTIRDLVEDSGAGEDPALVDLAQQLLQALDTAGGQTYTVTQHATATKKARVYQVGRDATFGPPQ